MHIIKKTSCLFLTHIAYNLATCNLLTFYTNLIYAQLYVMTKEKYILELLLM